MVAVPMSADGLGKAVHLRLLLSPTTKVSMAGLDLLARDV